MLSQILSPGILAKKPDPAILACYKDLLAILPVLEGDETIVNSVL